MTTIAYVREKLVAAQNCHPNAVQTLIEEALEAIDSIAVNETQKTAQHCRSNDTVQAIETPAYVDWKVLAEMGLLTRINHEILHPLGYAAFYVVETGISPGALVSESGGWDYTLEALLTSSSLPPPSETLWRMLTNGYSYEYIAQLKGDRRGEATSLVERAIKNWRKICAEVSATTADVF